MSRCDVPTTLYELHRIYEQRDLILFMLLALIGLLWAWHNRDLRDYEDFMRDHPGPAGQFKAWRAKRDHAKLARRPTSVICPIHKVFRDTCPPGSHDEVKHD